MGLFRRSKARAEADNRDGVSATAPLDKDMEAVWSELEAMSVASDPAPSSSAPSPEAPAPAAPDDSPSATRSETATYANSGTHFAQPPRGEARSSVTDDLKRYTEMDLSEALSAPLGNAPTVDATPGKIDVDVEALLAAASTPVAKAPVPVPPAVATPDPAATTASPASPAPVSPSPAPAAANREDVSAHDVPFEFNVPSVATREGRADLGSMRLDVARIAADIQSGEELYRRAQKRIENLTGFVEKAELDFSLLNRLEPENRRLKARNRTLESEIDDAKRKVDVMRADLEDHQKRLAERSAILEQLHSKMSVAQKSLQEYERALNQTRVNSDKHALAAERAQTSLDVERRENQVLREKVTELTASLDDRHTQTLEAQKMADSLRQDTVDFRAQAESLSSENIELRNALDHAQRSNNQMKGEMLSLHEDIRTFKTTSEFHVIAREDEMTALKAQLDELSKQLEIKDEIVRNAARDVQELRKVRTAQDLERERLESIIETQTFQLDEAGARLMEAQQNVTDFDRRYRDVAAALNQQRVAAAPSAAVVSASAAYTPAYTANPVAGEIMPAMHTHYTTGPLHDDPATGDPLVDPRMKALSDELEGEEIEARITEFALGLRDDIAS